MEMRGKTVSYSTYINQNSLKREKHKKGNFEFRTKFDKGFY